MGGILGKALFGGGDVGPDTRNGDRNLTCLDNPLPGSTPSTQNGGWQYYAPRGRDGRAEGAVVCASKTNPKHNSAARPAGWDAAEAMAERCGDEVNSCHLAPSALGGRGVKANVAACWRDANVGANSMREFETQAADLVEDDFVVEYMAMPAYRGAKSAIPMGFYLSYIAQDPVTGISRNDSVYISNDSNHKLPNLGN